MKQAFLIQVACRQLGFQDTVQTEIPMTTPPVTTEKVWLDNLQCSGREGYLSDCPGADWGVISELCNHTNSAHVICAGMYYTVHHSEFLLNLP